MNDATQTITRRRPLRSFLDEMFEDVFAPLVAGGPAARSGLPAMNVAETSEAFRLAFEFPGIEEKDIQVQVDGTQLVVSAERKFENEKVEGADYHRVEHRYGSFARSVAMPKDVRTDAITASFKNGVLTVVVPKAEPTRARKIEIKTT